MFTNLFREDDDRGIAGKPLSGVVVNNNDPKQCQRVQIRIHDLHGDIQDSDLPWFGPNQNSASSGAANIGDHGPLPTPGSKVWVTFPSDDQYHGSYGGGVATSQNQIPEFTGAGSSSSLGGTDGTYNFASDYPDANGGVDASGSFTAQSTKTDVTNYTHVSGTGSSIDGMGNHVMTVNGGATRGDNPNAAAIHPTGGSYAVFGDCTLYVSGNLTISVGGNVTVNAGGTATVSCSGKMQILGNDELFLTSAKDMYISSGTKIAMQAPVITSQPPIVPGPGIPPIAPQAITPQTAPTPRSRPTISVQPNDTTY